MEQTGKVALLLRPQIAPSWMSYVLRQKRCEVAISLGVFPLTALINNIQNLCPSFCTAKPKWCKTQFDGR